MQVKESVYKSIIDELVENAKRNNYKNISEEGFYSNGPDSKSINSLVESLTQDERKTLVELLMETEKESIHGVLSLLSWWIECKGLKLVHDGEELKVDLSGMGLHGDFVGRLQGWEWPNE